MTLDLQALIAERSGEKFDLYSRYLNVHRANSARRIGMDRVYVSAEGCWIIDSEGGRTLDCDGGNAVFAVGRNAPRVREALRGLLDSRPANWVTRDTPLLAGLLAEALAGMLPAGLDRVLFANTGSETVDAAIKLARRATGHSRILCLDGSFHGLTFGALSITDPSSRLALNGQNFEPLVPGCFGLPWNDLESLRRELAKGDVAALVLEPVQGASVREVPRDYLVAARDLCSRHGALLIADEILCGLGRCGTFLAIEPSGVTPDVALFAKGLSGGMMPIGAMVVRDAVWEKLFQDKNCFIHASTFGENDYAMAAGLATLDIIRSEGLIERARTVGARWLEQLRGLQERHPMIGEVRGRGLLIGVHLRAAGGWLRNPAASWLEQRGQLGSLVFLWLNTHYRIHASASTRNNVLRFIPPLIIEEEQCTQVVAALDEILTQAEKFPDGVGRMLFERLREM